MATPLQALIAEDNEADAALMLREIERAGYSVTWQRVDTAAGLSAALATKRWDVVLSDYSMPGFGALAALDVLKASGQDLPFLIVSGAIDEETAVEGLRAGAHDFIVKGRLARLPTAIDREVRAARSRAAQREEERKNAELVIERQRAEDRLRLVIDAAPSAMVMADERGLMTLVNARTEQLFRYTSAELLGQSVELLVPDRFRAAHADQRREFQDREARPKARGRDLFGRRKDSSEMPVEIELIPFRTAEGRFVLASIVDITERKNAEMQLLERTKSLAQANEDLEQFAYAASHDLRAPLRAIHNLAKWLGEDLGGDIAPESREHLNLMQQRVRRMDALLDGLLNFARIGRVQFTPELVDVGVLLAGVIELLGPPAGFTITVRAPMPKMETSHAALQQVLLNLIVNAVKHHDRPTGTIEVSAEDLGDQVCFSVTDDGPGIPDEAHERIFEIFQTLKPRDEVEGTGMGLALVKKQVERFGGTVGLRSAQGRGTCFHFTWSKSVPAGTAS